MSIAELTASRATCPRAKVGAVIVKNNQILVSGYNGAPKGLDHCTDEGCKIIDNHCLRAVHAEMNAICNCAKQGDNTEGCTIYVTHFPCVRCMPLIIQSGIKAIYYINDYNIDSFAREIAEQSGLMIRKMKPCLNKLVENQK